MHEGGEGVMSEHKSRLGVVLASGLAVATAALSGLTILTLAGSGQVLNLAQADEDRANAALGGPLPDFDLARRSTLAALEQAPGNPSAWARLAYIERLNAGRLTPQALAYLAKSYEAAPLGPDVSAWRLRFLYEHWGQLTPDLRNRTMIELRTLARYRGSAARDVVAEIQDPAGRLAAGLTLDLGRADGRRDRAAREAMQG